MACPYQNDRAEGFSAQPVKALLFYVPGQRLLDRMHRKNQRGR
jgi:hypothetical protein